MPQDTGMIETHIERINTAIRPLQGQIINHKVYSVIKTLDDLKVFMKYHVYAVWDFMSLLKSLQNDLTCTNVPWFPKGDAETRYLINEIVTGEESDIDMNGNYKSHFELYLEAMKECEADVEPILHFTGTLEQTGDFPTAFERGSVPQAARQFVGFTFDVINSRKSYLKSAIFTFGREDLIPEMFVSLINDINKALPHNVSILKYYLDRHIEVDGDHHSQLALKMTANLCGYNAAYWQESEAAIITSLHKRIALWDGAYEELVAMQNS